MGEKTGALRVHEILVGECRRLDRPYLTKSEADEVLLSTPGWGGLPSGRTMEDVYVGMSNNMLGLVAYVREPVFNQEDLIIPLRTLKRRS